MQSHYIESPNPLAGYESISTNIGCAVYAVCIVSKSETSRHFTISFQISQGVFVTEYWKDFWTGGTHMGTFGGRLTTRSWTPVMWTQDILVV